jgi:hypothetical protein
MKFKKIYLAPNIIHLKFKRQKDLTRFFMRFQEHFESPEFRGKIFTIAEFKKWYKKEKKSKKFTYYKDWTGFNIPSRILKPFVLGKFDPLTKFEKIFLDLTKNEEGRFYVIGTFKNGDLRHEVAHALFYVNPAYRREVKKILKTMDLKIFYDQFKQMGGYHPSVWLDETHAYLMEPDKKWFKDEFGFPVSKFGKQRKRLLAVFKKYKPAELS